jgi:hypothetical protein
LKTKEEIEIQRLEKSVRKFKALASKNLKLVKLYEREGDVTDKIVGVVRDSMETLPAIELPTLATPTNPHHEETALLLLSDVHIGKKTISYNPKVFAERLETLGKSMISIVSAQRSIRPIRKLVIVMNGDIVDAEAVYPSQAVDHISIPIIDQIFTVGVPKLTEFLLFCLANFEEVECICQRGNHGRQNAAKWSSSKSTNWDFVIYKSLQAITSTQPRLKWNINTKDWKSTFMIYHEGFLACHGDMIQRYYNLPHYGMTRQSERWQGAYRDRIKLTHFLFSHFHSLDAGQRFNNCMIYINGSFVTDDPYAEENIGVTSTPEQLLMGVHPIKGVSWRYPLKLV